MNAAKQEMFESVRSVVAGRLRDEMQVRELATHLLEGLGGAVVGGDVHLVAPGVRGGH